MDMQAASQVVDTSYRFSIGALIASLVALGSALAHWVKTREDITRLQAEQKSNSEKYADLKEIFHRIEDKLEEIQGFLYHCRVVSKDK